MQARVGEAPVVVVRGPDNGVRAFLARMGGHALDFEATSKPHTLRDEGGSLWEFPAGVSIEGDLKGNELEEIVVTHAFWFAWSGFYPNTVVVD